ncbi:MAG: YDG domain-containing protein, partial [Polaromonas sp.]
NRVYDGTTTAAVSLADNRVAGDVLTASNTAASFADKNVGTGKTVSVSGIGISGTDASNYTANTSTTTAANISRASIANVTGITANSKVVDGNTSATLNTGGAAYTGMVAGDALAVAAATGNFDTPAQGSGKTVYISGITLGGADANNYVLQNNTATTSASIVDFSSSAGTLLPNLPPPAVQLAPVVLPSRIFASLTLADANMLLETAPTASGGCPATSASCGGETRVAINILREPSGGVAGIVHVVVSADVMDANAGFRFELPASLATFSVSSGLPVVATTLSGQPMPEWLRYDAQSGTFIATAVPADGLPLQLRVGVGSRSVVLTISQAPDKAAPPRKVFVDGKPVAPADRES